MELARIVADSVPQEAPPATPVRRPPVLIAPRRPVTPNMRPLPSERAAAAARAAAEAANAPAPSTPTDEEVAERGEEALVETPAVEAETSAPAETIDAVEVIETVATPATRTEPEPEPEPEPEIDEFERALSAELGAAPLRAPAEAPPSASTPEPRSRVNLTRNDTSPRPAEAPAGDGLPVFVRRQQPEAAAPPAEPSPPAVTATPLPPRPTVADLAAALSLELDVASEAAPAETDATPPPADKRDGPRPAVQSAASVWLAQLPALELPPPDGEEPAAASSEDAEADDERARRIAEREQRREQRRAARAQRRSEEEADASPEPTPVPVAPVVAAVAGGLGKSSDADTPRAKDKLRAVEKPVRGENPLASERPAGTARAPADVPAIETTRPVASPRTVAAPFDFDAFEAEIRSSLDDGPLPEPVRPASAPRAEAPRAESPRAESPAVVAKPSIPKPAGLTPASVPGRPGEAAPASFAPPVAALPLAASAVDEGSAAPRPPKAPDDGFDLDALESEPGISEDAVLPPHSDAEQRALRSAMRGRRRAPVVAIAAAAAVVLLAGGATAWWLMSSETADGPPPLIQAEVDPVKIDPPVSEARDAGEPGKAFTDRVSEAGDPARQVLDPEGRQTIDLPIAGRQAGDPSLPGVDTDDPLAQLAADPNAPVETFAPEPAAEMQPKRVRTVVVRPDGTIVPQQDLPTTVTPEPQAPPAAGLATDPATVTAEPGGFAPGSQATTAPAADPIPVLEPAAGEADSLAGAIGYPMPRRKPLVFDETADLQPRPTSNLPDPLPAAAGTQATPVFGSTQGVATGATGTPSSEPATALPAASATDAAAAALARGTTTGDVATTAPAAVPAPTVTTPQPAAPEPVAAAAPEPVQPAADDAASADTRAVTTTPIRVATPAARQDPPPAVDTAPAAVEPPLSLPAVTPQPTAPQAAAPAAAAPVAAGRSARLLPPAGAGINPFAPSTEQPTAAAAPPPPAAETAPAPAAAAPAAATTAGGAFAVQLASQKSDAEARAAYASLQRRFPSILGGLSPVIQTADVGTRGTFYRVRLPFGSATEANRLCNDLKAAGGDCFVGRN